MMDIELETIGIWILHNLMILITNFKAADLQVFHDSLVTRPFRGMQLSLSTQGYMKASQIRR